jgi:hypothetical protein
MSVFDKRGHEEARRWRAPELKTVGTVGEVLQGGGGKNSPAPADPGDIRKPKGQANEN